MYRKFIAALLMLIVSGTGALAQSLALPPQPMATHSHNHAGSAHECCHSPGPTFAVALPLMPANMPCGNQHSCCLRPAPANSSSLPTNGAQQRPGSSRASQNFEPMKESTLGVPASAIHPAGFLVYAMLSTVLRI
jgi:hypothetical protein